MRQPDQVLASSRYEWAAETLERLRPAGQSCVVFDIGAGEGPMRQAVEACGCTWFGFDVAPAVPAVARWDLALPCPMESPRPDFVLLLDVIEHLVNPGIALRHIASVLRPGGRLVMTMPNPRWSRSRIDALMTGFLTCFSQADLDGNGHVFPPWPHVLVRMLEDAGLTVETYVTLDGRSTLPGRPYGLRYPLRLGRALASMLIEHRDPSACGMSYGLVASTQGAQALPVSTTGPASETGKEHEGRRN